MPRNIVVCCDGTWNRFDRQRNTNVVRLASCLVRHSERQVAFYDPGVGTIAAERWRTRFGRAWSKLLGGAFGAGLATNLEEAYSFIAEHYTEGDRIYLFGFSRGAYTARALASVIRMFGLLERQNDNLYPYVREIVVRRLGGKPDFDLAAKFRHNFARTIRVHFVGVWDTVSSVGWITSPVSLPFTKSNPIIDHVRHAVSIDERRKSFRHNLFRPADGQDLKEVWFAGAHADVGGGYEESESGLAKISLEWMIREAVACGLEVDAARVTRILGLDNAKYVKADAAAHIHNPLDALFWKLAQYAPRRTYDMSQDPPKRSWDFSVRARERWIDGDAVLHQSAIDRMEKVPTYRPGNLGQPSTHAIEPWRRWSAAPAMLPTASVG